METKKCTECKKIKNVEEFYWRKTRNNFSPKCKICWIEDSKKYNIKHKSERKEYLKEWRKDNDKLRKYQREYKRKAPSQDRIIFNLRNRVYKLMLKEFQSQKTLELIGCSRQKF